MKKIISLALLVLVVAALLVMGCQKSTPLPPPVTGEAVGSEDQQIANSLDDLNDWDGLDQDLSADLEELDNINLE